MKNQIAGMLFLVFCFTGCASISDKIWTSEPPIRTVNEPHYTIQLEPIKINGNFFEIFRLTIRNKSDHDLTVNWNKTRYLYKGKADGSFAFSGIDPKAVQSGTVEPDIISSGSTFSKEIAPIKLIAYMPYRESNVNPERRGISGGIIPEGINGMLLVMEEQGREHAEKISIRIIQGEKE